VLLAVSYRSLVALGDEHAAAEAAVRTTAAALSGGVGCVATLLVAKHCLNKHDESLLRGALSTDVIDGVVMGWAEATTAALRHLLQSVSSATRRL
jgi:hypothetical protein